MRLALDLLERHFAEGSVLSLQQQRVRSGKQTFTVIVDQDPQFVGFDPYNKYVDLNSEDNVVKVEVAEAAT